MTSSPAQLRAYKNYRARVKAKVLAHYGNHCAACGTDKRLEINHLHGGGSDHRIELFGSNTGSTDG